MDKTTNRLFCVPILNTMVHDDETREILAPYKKMRKQSEFIREAILDFAFEREFIYGMNHILEDNRPEYIQVSTWRRIMAAHRKTHYIKFGYVVAFCWLLNRDEFKGYGKSKLIREIIVTQSKYYSFESIIALP